MQIAEMVNLQMIVPNAANVNVPAQTAGESFADTLNGISETNGISLATNDVEKSLAREIQEVVEKILTGKMRPESVPKKFLCFEAVKAAIKAVMKFYNKTEDEIEQLLMTAVQPDGAEKSKEDAAENPESCDNEPNYRGVNVPIITDCAEELAAVKGISPVNTADLLEPTSTVQAEEVTNETTSHPKTSARHIEAEISMPNTVTDTTTVSKAATVSEKPQPTINGVQQVPVSESTATATERQENIPTDNISVSEIEPLITENPTETRQSPTSAPQETSVEISELLQVKSSEEPAVIPKQSTEISAFAGAYTAKNEASVQQMQNNGQSDQYSGNSHTSGKAQEVVFTALQSDKATDFNITRFVVKTKQAATPETHTDSVKATFARETIKPHMTQSTEIKELVVPKEKAQAPQVTEQVLQPQQTVKLEIDGKEVEIKPAQVLKQVTQSITERIHTTVKQDEYVVELEPASLGKITVKLIKESGKLSVMITAENKNTETLLADKAAFIREAVRENGVQLESWQVVSQSKQYAAQDYNGSSKNPYYREETNGNADDDEAESFSELLASM